ncbi:MAG: AAA family ATPase [Chloroflexi bacterium]|nr:AAA family ATPase [Chloroflexota bacterium]MCY3937064.1 AAA family ATPase [Chloroflexota bacterium]
MAKKTGRGAEAVYRAASRWVDAALRKDDSLFTPGTAIWSLSNLDDFYDRFVLVEDESSDSFEVKLERLLSGAPSETIQLAAEILYVHFLLPVPRAVGGRRKRELVSGQRWADSPIAIPEDLAEVLNDGLVHPGAAFIAARHSQISLIGQFLREWKQLSDDEQVEALRHPYTFKGELYEPNVPGSQTQRDALLHLVFPDDFEPIVTESDKRALVRAFDYLVESPTDDGDRTIDEIRSRLTVDYGYADGFDFYDGPVGSLWKWGADPWAHFIHWARRFFNWPEFDKTERDYKLKIAERLGKGRTIDDWRSKEWGESLAAIFKHKYPLVSFFTYDNFLKWFRQEPRQAQAAMAAIWTSDVSANERVREFSERLPRDVVNGRGTRLNLASFLMMGVDAVDFPIYQVTALEKGFDLTGHARPPNEADEAETYEHALGFFDGILEESSKRGLKLRDRLDAQSLLWLMVKWPAEDLPISNAERDAFDRYREGIVVVPPPNPPPLEELASRLLIDAAHLKKIERLLEDKRQVIFYGPPGTGKTYVARKFAETVAGADGAVRLVQFHPSYAYEDFVEGFRPAELESGQAGFKLREGPLKRLADQARESESEAIHVLIIDEINRGNLAKVFGELYFLLEYRDQPIRLQYSDKKFRLPKNLWIIGTMNTADRTISLLDAALRRRFHFFPFFPDEEPIEGLLRRWLGKKKPHLEWVAEAVDQVNRELGDRQTAVGPSHFLRDDLDGDWIDLVWEHSVLPYIQDQLLGEGDRYRDFELDKVRQRIGPAETPESATESSGDAPSPTD